MTFKIVSKRKISPTRPVTRALLVLIILSLPCKKTDSSAIAAASNLAMTNTVAQKEIRVTYANLQIGLNAIKKQISKRPDRPDLAIEWANLNTYVRKADFITKRCLESEHTYALLSNELWNAGISLESIRKQESVPLIKGERGEGYYCDNDGSFQPFLRFLPDTYQRQKKRPLIVFLHGYSPNLNLINWSYFPDSLVEFAQAHDFCLVAPFGRSNTDFQAIGEQDVMRVIDEMKNRYAIDSERIILTGISMGGMGTWTIGAHYPAFFAGLLIISGRGDYYFWRKIDKRNIPYYKRVLIDAEFGLSLLPNLRDVRIMSVHGAMDSLIPVEEARLMNKSVRRINPDMTYIEIPEGDHWIYEKAYARADVHKWLLNCRKDSPADQTRSKLNMPSRNGPLSKAFLAPFMFVCTSAKDDTSALRMFRETAFEWYRYSKSLPRVAHELNLTKSEMSKYNLIVQGEPENSELIRTILKASPFGITKTHYVVGDKKFPRKGNGVWLLSQNPWNKAKMAVLQCGLPWGAGLPENHKYDMLPDYIVYTSDRDPDGCDKALCAGFLDEHWQIDTNRIYLP